MIKKTKYRKADSDFSCSNTGITQDIRIGCELWVSIRGSQDPPFCATHPCSYDVVLRHGQWLFWVLPCHIKRPVKKSIMGVIMKMNQVGMMSNECMDYGSWWWYATGDVNRFFAHLRQVLLPQLALKSTGRRQHPPKLSGLWIIG